MGQPRSPAPTVPVVRIQTLAHPPRVAVVDVATGRTLKSYRFSHNIQYGRAFDDAEHQAVGWATARGLAILR